MYRYIQLYIENAVTDFKMRSCELKEVAVAYTLARLRRSLTRKLRKTTYEMPDTITLQTAI